MQGKTKLAFFAIAAVCVLAFYKYTRDGNIDIDIPVNVQAIKQGAVEAVLPGWSYSNEKGTSLSQGTVLEVIAKWVKNTLFPGDSYTKDTQEDALTTMDEYYPSRSDMEAFCEENDNYEILESQAESRRIESEAQASQDSESPSFDITETQPQTQTQIAQNDENIKNDAIPAVATPANGIIYPTESLYNYTFLMNNFYVVDSSTASDASLIDGETLLNKDLTMDLTGDDPKVLIYHTHSQEKFVDSKPGDVNDTVVGLGNTLTNVLKEKYNISAYHDTGVYDMINGVEDRNEAYSLSLAAVEKILADNPSIKVVIDLHRDGVAEGTHLVTNVNGKPTAKIMFFNGMCRSSNNDISGFMQNPYLSDNLAFSLQMEIKAEEKFPEFVRRIYLRNYRYNMHVKPRTLLVECGAQTNTVAEVNNAMEPLADLLYCVLSGQ